MSENNRASVYVHINLINGKKYFGITTQNPPEKRWKNGNGYYNNAHFMSAVKKYGWTNFAHYVLYRNIPIAIAKNIEEMLIREHITHDPRFGYNKTLGGELEKHTKETREKLSEAHRGKTINEETRRKISEAMKGDANPAKRPDVARKIGKANSKPVEALDPKSGQRALYFKSASDAERAGFHQGHISECCLGKQKTHAGLIWRYIKEVSEDDTDSGQ